MIVIGILGGIASGKSLVTEQLRQLGAATLDADRIGHEVLLEQSVKQAIRQKWGDSVFTEQGEVSRPAIAKIVFAGPPHGPANLLELERITHPRITARLEKQIHEFTNRDVAVAVLDAPVLLKAGWNRFCDHIVFVEASFEQRVARAARRGWTEAELIARERAQEPLDEKRKIADTVIDNSGSAEETLEQVKKLWHRISL